ncbi:VOC family protein [Exiguobacterium artemiae]|uniref:VOC family protein n=1 Tax=Exiguobacterium artemiae TaxID=340145 RepID=UPI003CFCCA26
MLFHYHLWTPFVEETERFYQQLGFQVTQRIGKIEGAFTSFDPPLHWDDFRQQRILFRIIEMKRGAINITFGHGKKVMFDHIGFLVTEADRLQILDRAEGLGLTVQANERRTFIGTPFGFRIELQTHPDAVQSQTGDQLLQLGIATPTLGLEPLLSQLLARPVPEITTSAAERMHVRQAVFSGIPALPEQDPNGLEVRTVSPLTSISGRILDEDL